MTAFHTTTADLGNFLTGLIAKPAQAAKQRRSNELAASAMKYAWEYYREQVTPGRPFCAPIFKAHLKHGWQTARIMAGGPYFITEDERKLISGGM